MILKKNNADETPMSDSPEPTIAAPIRAASTDASVSSLIGNLILIFVVACFAAMAVVLIHDSLVTKEPSAQKMVIVDANQLVQEQISMLGKRGRTGQLNLEEMPKRSKVFGEALMTELRSYTDNGVIVIRADSVIAKPASLEDITSSIRNSLQSKGFMEKPDEEIKP